MRYWSAHFSSFMKHSEFEGTSEVGDTCCFKFPEWPYKSNLRSVLVVTFILTFA